MLRKICTNYTIIIYLSTYFYFREMFTSWPNRTFKIQTFEDISLPVLMYDTGNNFSAWTYNNSNEDKARDIHFESIKYRRGKRFIDWGSEVRMNEGLMSRTASFLVRIALRILNSVWTKNGT